MPSGISLPTQLGVPLKSGYSATFEESRSAVEMESGLPRRRQVYRRPPQIFDLKWDFTQGQFTVFDIWWQNSIDGGSREFDIQLLDDDESIVWYTVTALGVYTAEVSLVMDWTVSLRVRALDDNFGPVRLSGTDELIGSTSVGIVASGNLQVGKPIRGSAEIGMQSVGTLIMPGIHGSASFGMDSTSKASFSNRAPIRGKASVGMTNTLLNT